MQVTVTSFYKIFLLSFLSYFINFFIKLLSFFYKIPSLNTV